MQKPRKILVFVNSDYYAQIRPESLGHIKEQANSPNKAAFYPFTKNSPTAHDFHPKAEQIQVSALHYIRYTYLDVFNIMTKAINIVESTEEFVEYSLLKTFSDKKQYGTPPGSVRFYSQDLICFFNGKNWRKLDP